MNRSLFTIIDSFIFGKIDILNIWHKQIVSVNLMRNSKATKKEICYLLLSGVFQIFSFCQFFGKPISFSCNIGHLFINAIKLFLNP